MIGWLKKQLGHPRDTRLETKRDTALESDWFATVGSASWPARVVKLTPDAVVLVMGNFIKHGSALAVKLTHRRTRRIAHVTAQATSVQRQLDGKWRVCCLLTQRLTNIN